MRLQASQEFEHWLVELVYGCQDLAQAYDPKTDDVPLAEIASRAVEGSLGLPMAVQIAAWHCLAIATKDGPAMSGSCQVAPPWREELCLGAMLEAPPL